MSDFVSGCLEFDGLRKNNFVIDVNLLTLRSIVESSKLLHHNVSYIQTDLSKNLYFSFDFKRFYSTRSETNIS